MIAISLKDFLTTGKFGPVTLGMTRRNVARLLGDPDGIAEDIGGCPCIWKYGDIEMIFGARGIKLDLIDFHHFEGVPNGGSRISLDPWIIRTGLSCSLLKAALCRARIPFGLTDWSDTIWGAGDSTTRLWCGPGIEIIFIRRKTKYGGPAGFHGAFYSPEPPRWKMLTKSNPT